MGVKPLNVLAVLVYIYAFFSVTDKTLIDVPPGDDNGPPLILTPLIEAGRVEEARNLSRVGVLKEGVDVESYSGFFEVNAEYKSCMFFWYFPPENKNLSAPVLLWLQGGPGVSSLFGLFLEHGPYFLDERGELQRRQHHWSLTHHLVYIDNPVGTGFSYTQDRKGYAENQTDVARDLYSALVQFFSLFPDLQANEFYVSGESYAGKYVPAIGYAIHTNNPRAKLKINLKGVAIGNGLIDPESMMVYGDYFYQLGLVDFNARQHLREEEAKIVAHIHKEEWTQATMTYTNLLGEGSTSYLGRLTGFSHFSNYLHAHGGPEHDDDGYQSFVRSGAVRSAVHVGGREFQSGVAAESHLFDDVCRSARPWLEALLEAGYRVLVYAGQLDLVCPHPGVLGWLEAGRRRPWLCRGWVAGFAAEEGGLAAVLVRNAGHLVPADQPECTLHLITTFTSGSSFFKIRK